MKQVVVITGLAQGMGLEVTRRLAKENVSIAGFDLDKKSIASLNKELDAAGCESLLRVVDITDRPAVLAFRDEVLKTFDHVDTVLSNAGVAFFGPFEEVDLERALKCLEINAIGTAAIFQAFLPSMRERRSGKLVAMSSLVGQIPFPFESIYSASKFAVEGLVQSIRVEVAPFGIKVALIQPAQVSTSFAAGSHKLPPKDSPYYDRVARFIAKDEELIKTAPTPEQAGKVIASVVMSKNPKLFNQLESKSTFFLTLNRVLPPEMRDRILTSHMGINE